MDQDGRFSADIDRAAPGIGTMWLRAEDRFGHLTLRAVRLGGQQPAAIIESAPSSGAAAAVEAAPTVASPATSNRIEILSPAGIGWYRSRLTVEGRLTEPSVAVESLAWNVSGDRGILGRDSRRQRRYVPARARDRRSHRRPEPRPRRGAQRAEETVEASVALRDGRRAPDVRIGSPGKRRRVRSAAAAHGFRDRSLRGHRRDGRIRIGLLADGAARRFLAGGGQVGIRSTLGADGSVRRRDLHPGHDRTAAALGRRRRQERQPGQGGRPGGAGRERHPVVLRLRRRRSRDAALGCTGRGSPLRHPLCGGSRGRRWSRGVHRRGRPPAARAQGSCERIAVRLPHPCRGGGATGCLVFGAGCGSPGTRNAEARRRSASTGGCGCRGRRCRE